MSLIYVRKIDAKKIFENNFCNNMSKAMVKIIIKKLAVSLLIISR